MHRITLARKLAWSVLLVALFTTLGLPTLAQEVSAPLLDLSKPAPREQWETGVPGGHVGGVGGHLLPSRYLLPLKIELTSISPKPSKTGERFSVEVLLQNTGASPFFLPASQNGVEVLGHEGKGRRSFVFNLIFEDPKSGRQLSSFAAVAMGSDTVQESLLRVEPGKEVRVLFTGDLGPIADWLNHGLDQIQIRAGASETTFEDMRYFIKNQSEPIVSDNVRIVNLTAP